MRKIFHSLLVVLCTVSSFAQTNPLQVSSKRIDFGNVDEVNKDSIQISIKNTGTVAYQLGAWSQMRIYNHFPFAVSDSNFVLAPNDSIQLWVSCLPVHNIKHNSELFIVNNSGHGPVRIDLAAQGTYTNTYYSHTQNLEGQILKDSLSQILARRQSVLGYNIARDRMFMVIDNKKINGQGATVNTLECPYSARVITSYADRAAAQNAPNNFNTEHTWPQSMGASNDPMQSDLHHLYAVDGPTNSERSNKPFGMVSSASWTLGGSKSNAQTFEPRDAHKGNCARSMLYFATRYQNQQGIVLTFLTGQEAILRSWAKQFPPTNDDILRNQTISLYQFNRNPYVDYPQFLDRISSLSQMAVVPQTRRVFLPETKADLGAVPVGQTGWYDVWIANEGNATLLVAGLNANGNGFSVVGKTDTTILPGEALSVRINYTASNQNKASSNLTFVTNDNLKPSVSIALEANGSTSITAIKAMQIAVYPNPGTDKITLVGDFLTTQKTFAYTITDTQGRSVKTGNLEAQSGMLQVDISDLSTGFYQLNLNDKALNNYTAKFNKL